jgi:hypothetical protein
MRGLMTALCRKLGLIRTSGIFKILSDSGSTDSYTIGGASFICTDKGVEGPIWPSVWDNPSWEAGSPPCEAMGDPSMESWCYSI